MNKESWRDLLREPSKPMEGKEDEYKPQPDETSEAIYTPMFYMMYRRGLITKEQYKLMASRSNPMEFEDFMDKLTEITE